MDDGGYYLEYWDDVPVPGVVVARSGPVEGAGRGRVSSAIAFACGEGPEVWCGMFDSG